MEIKLLCWVLPMVLLSGCAQTLTLTEVHKIPVNMVSKPTDHLRASESTTRERDCSIAREQFQLGGAAFRQAGLINTLYDAHFEGDYRVVVNKQASDGIRPKATMRFQKSKTEADRHSTPKSTGIDGKSQSIYGY